MTISSISGSTYVSPYVAPSTTTTSTHTATQSPTTTNSVTVSVSSTARVMLASATVAPTTYTAADAVAKYKAAIDAGTLADLEQLKIQDTAANIQANLADLSALAKDKKLSGVVLSGTAPSLTIDRSTVTGDLASTASTNGTALLLQKISSGYTLKIENATAADALTLKKPSTAATLSINVRDTAASVGTNLDKLQALVKSKTISGLTLTDGASAPLKATVAQLTSAADLLKAVKGSYKIAVDNLTAASALSLRSPAANGVLSITVKDSAANISNNLDRLQALVKSGNISALSITDGSASPIKLTSAQATSASDLLGKLQGTYKLAVSGVKTADVTQTLTVKNISTISVSDTAANVQANMTSLGDLAKAKKLSAVTLTSTAPSLTIDRTTVTGDLSSLTTTNGTIQLLQRITNAHTLQISNVSAKDALTLKSPNKMAKLAIGVKDTAANVLANLDKLQPLASSKTASSITFSDQSAPTLKITSAQLAAGSAAIKAIQGSYQLHVTNVKASELATVAASSLVSSINLTDTNANIITALRAKPAATTLAKVKSVAITDKISITNARNLVEATKALTATFSYSISDTSNNLIAQLRYDDKNLIAGADKIYAADKTPANLSVSDARVLLKSSKLAKPVSYNIVDTADAIGGAVPTTESVITGAKKVSVAQKLSVQAFAYTLSAKSFDKNAAFIVEDSAQNIIAEAKKGTTSVLSKAAAVMVADTGSTISATMTDLQTYVAAGQIQRLRLTDATPVKTLNLSADQLSASAGVIGRVQNLASVNVSGKTDTIFQPLSPIMAFNLPDEQRFYYAPNAASYQGDQIWALQYSDAPTHVPGSVNKTTIALANHDRLDANLGSYSVEIAEAYTGLPKSQARVMTFARPGTSPYVAGGALWLDLGSSTGTSYSLKYQKFEFTPFSFIDGSISGRKTGEMRLVGQPMSLITEMQPIEDYSSTFNSTGFSYLWSTPSGTAGKKDVKLAFFDTNGVMQGTVQTIATLNMGSALSMTYDPDGNMEVVTSDAGTITSNRYSPTSLNMAHYASTASLDSGFDAGTPTGLSNPSYLNAVSGVYQNEVFASSGSVNGVKQLKFSSIDTTTNQIVGSQTVTLRGDQTPTKILSYRMSDNMSTAFAYQDGNFIHLTTVDAKAQIISDYMQPVMNSLQGQGTQFATIRGLNDGRVELSWRENTDEVSNTFRYQILDTRTAPVTLNSVATYPSLLGGTSGNDTITLNYDKSIVEGGAGADTLTNTIIATPNMNFVSYVHSTSGVTIDLSTNTVTGGHAEGDQLSGFSNVIGSIFDDTLIGTSGMNIFSGRGGNDIILGNGSGDEVWYTGKATDYAVTGRSDGTFIVKDLRTDSPDGTDSLSGISTLAFRDGVKISLAGTVSSTQPSGGNLDRSGLGLVGDSNMGSSVTVSATVRSDAALFGDKTIFMQYAYSGSTPVIYKAIVHDGNQTSWTSWDTGTDVTQYCSVSSTASNSAATKILISAGAGLSDSTISINVNGFVNPWMGVRLAVSNTPTDA